ncbi:MAG: hypothetical protein LUF27_06680 [Lachnospiraceae bacterium]|nr:hypothetical protein [Lachnospiraceae bacterium]
MCEAAEQLINWGIEQGIEQGIERGVAQGDAGRARKAAKNMRKKGSELSYIAEVLDSSIEQVEEWLAEDES